MQVTPGSMSDLVMKVRWGRREASEGLVTEWVAAVGMWGSNSLGPLGGTV